MPSTVERPIPANVVAHATEYPSDRERREREDNRRKGSESAAAQRPETGEPDQDEPAVLIDDHHETSHILDGVSAYQAAAHHVLDPVAARGSPHPLAPEPGAILPETVRHAYEDHDEEPPHKVNVAT